MKKPWLVRLHRGLYYPVIIRDYFINHDIRIPSLNNQYDSWKVRDPGILSFRGSGDIAGQYLGYVVGRQLAFRNLSGNEAPRGTEGMLVFPGDPQKWRGKKQDFRGP